MADNDLKNLSIEEQLEWLMEGTFFADEGGIASKESVAEHEQKTDPMKAVTVPAGADEKEFFKEHPELTAFRGSLRYRAKFELLKKLRWSAKNDTPLRVYLGVDPTRDSLHIGHMIPAKYLRRFQLLGHRVVFLMGDYTATIGDPSGQSKEREQLTHERVLAHAKFYADQAFRLLDPELTEVRYNSEWLSDLRFAQIAELAALFPLGQIIARQDFRTRLESGAGVRFHECLYSLMQGYDAFALNCDVQVGAYDQHFNLLAGRIIQQHFADKLKGAEHPLFATHPDTRKNVHGPHVMLTIPLLMGTDGRKMSKSWGNTIDVLDSAEDMFGKVMRISDEMIDNYIDIAVEVRQVVKEEWKAKAKDDPMGVKKWIAGQITAMYHGADGAARAEEHFRRTVQEKSFSADDIPEVEVPVEFCEDGKRLADLIVALKLSPSKKEAQRLIDGGGVKLDDVPVSDKLAEYSYKAGVILRVGKRKIVKLV